MIGVVIKFTCWITLWMVLPRNTDYTQASWCFFAYCHDLCRLSFVVVCLFVHRKLSSSCNWKPRITKIYIHANLVCSHTGYDVTSCFRSSAKCNWILHKTGPAGKESNNSATLWRKITTYVVSMSTEIFKLSCVAFLLASYDVTGYFMSYEIATGSSH